MSDVIDIIEMSSREGKIKIDSTNYATLGDHIKQLFNWIDVLMLRSELAILYPLIAHDQNDAVNESMIIRTNLCLSACINLIEMFRDKPMMPRESNFLYMFLSKLSDYPSAIPNFNEGFFFTFRQIIFSMVEPDKRFMMDGDMPAGNPLVDESGRCLTFNEMLELSLKQNLDGSISKCPSTDSKIQ